MFSTQLKKVIEYLKSNQQKLSLLFDFSQRMFLLLACTYLIASVISLVVMSQLVDVALSAYSDQKTKLGTTTLSLEKQLNYRDIRKVVLDRNLFNSEGSFPDEPEPVEGGDGIVRQSFNINDPCQKPSVAIKLLGTIYLGKTGPSLATVREENYSEADVYKVGDEVSGLPGVKVAAIEPNMLILNNKGIKECLTLTAPPVGQAPSSQATASAQPQEKPSDLGGSCSNIELTSSYVEKELGPGFSTILTKGRLVPHNENNTLKGFKLISVDPGGLFGKICLQDNDLITAVNDTQMQPESGFALYQAFQDEREVRISFIRNNEPKSVTVRIK